MPSSTRRGPPICAGRAAERAGACSLSTLFRRSPSTSSAAMGAKAAFPGFRAMNAAGTSDWIAFAGASYFRSSGALDQYGLSARGIAINPGGQEEFPAFTKFWIGRGDDGALLVDALMEGPSITGAYR